MISVKFCESEMSRCKLLAVKSYSVSVCVSVCQLTRGKGGGTNHPACMDLLMKYDHKPKLGHLHSNKQHTCAVKSS